jgi:hypothetical protein
MEAIFIVYDCFVLSLISICLIVWLYDKIQIMRHRDYNIYDKP